ncbi:sulfolactate dehydrogenase [Tabrizicola sp. TH137]|uniref:Ldh family oxidoreductase n=1 Tax=Tabrizicola sp. TH137 TaxID=2067452 RepID=UPI000C7B2611|nr:Ldh family oxidoreductase [Tabrizicola sp. TH137]PLL12910.1 sulfolactate dehydrogenase [Tabrizicola sp. TH137]
MAHRLSLDEVETLALDCLTASGGSPLQAGAVARSIRDAEAEGTRGIGLGYLPWYCGHLKVGKIAGHALPTVRQTAPGMVMVDAGDGFAHPAYEAGEAALVAAARSQGIALIGISNAYACGVLGYFTARLARQGLVALMFANASSTMAPWGGCKPFFGTNPWSLAAPRNGAPLILDSSSSATAYVNLATAAARGELIPPHWALDAEGQPTTDAEAALQGSIAPAGGHKGSALALMVEVLAAGLTGAHFSHEASSLGDDLGGPPRLGQTLIAIHPGQAGFAARIEGLLAEMASQPGVRIPGDRRHSHRQRAEVEGVAVDDALMGRLNSLAGRR